MRTRSATASPATRATATWRASSGGASRSGWSASTSRSRCRWRGTASAAGKAASSATRTPTVRRACASTPGRNPSCSAGRRARPRGRSSPCRRRSSRERLAATVQPARESLRHPLPEPLPGGLRRRCELLLLGAAGERRDRGVAPRHRLRDRVEIAGAHLALMPRGGVAGGLGRELRLLELHVGAHVLSLVAARQLEHREVERVEAGERDELEAVAHGGELALELRDHSIIEMALPVERRRAVVGEELVGELRVDRLREFPRL